MDKKGILILYKSKTTRILVGGLYEIIMMCFHIVAAVINVNKTNATDLAKV